MKNYNRPITHAEIKDLVGRGRPRDMRTVILEIGCNNGNDSQAFLDTFPGPGLRLYCFEPDPRAIAQFKDRIRDPRCELIEAAIAADDGRTVLHMSGGRPPGHPPDLDWNMSSSIRQPTGHLQMSPWCTFDRKVEVETMRLDTWYKQHPELGTIDFIWADTQGAEVDLINGGRLALDNTRFCFTEFYNTPCYQGQINLAQIIELLGPRWQPMATYENYNVLMRNLNL